MPRPDPAFLKFYGVETPPESSRKRSRVESDRNPSAKKSAATPATPDQDPAVSGIEPPLSPDPPQSAHSTDSELDNSPVTPTVISPLETSVSTKDCDMAPPDELSRDRLTARASLGAPRTRWSSETAVPHASHDHNSSPWSNEPAPSHHSHDGAIPPRQSNGGREHNVTSEGDALWASRHSNEAVPPLPSRILREDGMSRPSNEGHPTRQSDERYEIRASDRPYDEAPIFDIRAGRLHIEGTFRHPVESSGDHRAWDADRAVRARVRDMQNALDRERRRTSRAQTALLQAQVAIDRSRVAQLHSSECMERMLDALADRDDLAALTERSN